MPSIAVVISTYNWPEALELVLQALARQSDVDFEVVIADDGSTQATQHIVEQFAQQASFPVKHVWHEDNGFRVAEIRNKAVHATTAEYIIFLDGDCIPRLDFVEKHKRLAKTGYFVVGNRLLLNQSFTSQVIEQQIPIYGWSNLQWLMARLKKQVNRFLPLLTFNTGADWRGNKRRDWRGAKGCNLAIWRHDLLQVNGWEQAFTGWGYEDSDLIIRLLRKGIQRLDGRFYLPVLHLWHPENDRSRLQENQQLLDNIQNSDRILAQTGLNNLTTKSVC